MNFYNIILHTLMEKAESHRVADVRIGLGYTAVSLDDGNTGLAYTFPRDLDKGCTVFTGKRPLSGKGAHEILPYIQSSNPVESAVGLATANALANVPHEALIQGDLLDTVHIGPDDAVGMVGYFAPLVPAIKKKAANLHIFEQFKGSAKNFLSVDRDADILSKCQVAILTSSAVVNQSIDSLLEKVGSCREIILLGASTPLLQEIFMETPVTCLSGVLVVNPRDILQIVSEGGGMRLFKNNIKKVNLINGN